MGEVYKATDTRLSRTVAIKVLPPHWVADAEMKQRFEREAQTVASLKHPNICVLHDIGADNGVDFLVMEFLDGETLAERIKKGPLPIDEALAVAIAVTDALDKAHRQNVVHRDLKPSNVMLTQSGPKLLDFGLAKTGPAPDAQALKSGLTTPGMLIGTLQYMAPEQLEGGDADARTDIFALGVLLHEMVTGKKVFEGKSRVLLMSAIATLEPPPLSTAEPSTPPALEHVVRTCLAKDPADRWQTARDLLAELQAIAAGADDGFVAASAAAARQKARMLPQALAALALVAGVVMAVPAYLYLRGEAPPGERRIRIPIQLTADTNAMGGNNLANGVTLRHTGFAVAPSGQWLAFAARESGNNPFLLYVRPMGGVAPQPLPGTEEAAQAFWSADNRSIAFVAGGKLRKVEATGGLPEDVCAVTDFSGGAWNLQGTIIFGSSQGLFKVPAQGGAPELITTLDASESGHHWPQFLPDGQHYLFTAETQSGAGAIYVGSLGSKDRKQILAVLSNAAYVRSSPDTPRLGSGQAGQPGYLLFHRDQAVYAQPFDANTLTLSGEPTRVADDVTGSSRGRGHFSVSQEGALAYFQNPGGSGGGSSQSDVAEWHLAWQSRTNSPMHTPGPPGNYRGVEISPADPKRIVVHKHEKEGGDIWIIEPTGAEARVTWDATQHNSSPIWSPDGKSVVFSSTRNGKIGLYQKLADGSGVDELLFESDLPKAPMSWSPDNKYIVFGVQDPKTGADLWLLALTDKKAAPFIATPHTETHAQISPDGKWIAYSSNSVGGKREIHVKAFPTAAGQWQASDAGGDWPRWRQDSKELFFHAIGDIGSPGAAGVPAPYSPLYAVAVSVNGAAFVPGPPAPVLQFRVLGFPHSGADYHSYAVSPDGLAFLYFQLMTTTSAATTSTTTIDADLPAGLIVAMHWTGTVKK
jgi:Tol biopolymer transport system component